MYHEVLEAHSVSINGAPAVECHFSDAFKCELLIKSGSNWNPYEKERVTGFDAMMIMTGLITNDPNLPRLSYGVLIHACLSGNVIHFGRLVSFEVSAVEKWTMTFFSESTQSKVVI